MGIDAEKFMKIADSLRQYRRSELKDFEDSVGKRPVDQLYVDALPNDAVLTSVLSHNTTFLLGRKGTGKSTVFARAQSRLRENKETLSIYIDVKSLRDLVLIKDIPKIDSQANNIDAGIFQAHILRKAFLGQITSEIIQSIKMACDEMSIWDRWRGRKRSLEELKEALAQIQNDLSTSKLDEMELPVLRTITQTWKHGKIAESGVTSSRNAGGGISPIGPKFSADASQKDFENSLDDQELYEEYSDVVLKSFPFNEILNNLSDLLEEGGLKRLVIFFDDFSELSFLDQKLFVDIVLSPLNNSSRELIKLKVAGYPGRVYYGKIDSTKVDTLSLDFASLYESSEVQSMENAAVDYTRRLLTIRFEAFGENIEDYFDPSSSTDAHFELIFKATFNVPRLMGALLHTCFLDNISKGKFITLASIRLAARKYYETTVAQYFDRLNRFALEPFENKLDRHNQQQLLQTIVSKVRETRTRILAHEVGGAYFKKLSNPPVSHFVVSSSLCKIFNSLEANFLLSRYKDTRDKSGNAVTVYALFHGLTEVNRVAWGYPDGREYRNYFVQRCFDYTSTVHHFLAQNQTIRCLKCGTSFSMELKPSIELYKWGCPECKEGICSITNLSDDFEEEVEQAHHDLQLETVELEILETLNLEDREMAAGEISSMIDTTYQLVGRRTSKLKDKGLIEKERDEQDRRMKSIISSIAKSTYFSDGESN